MIWKSSFGLAWSNLIQTPIRGILTTVGVMIGIGTLVCMVAFGLGLKKLTTDQVQRYNFLNTITVLATNPNSRGNRANQKSKKAILDHDAVTAIAQLPGVESATPLISFPLQLSRGDKSTTALGQSLAPGTLSPDNPLLKLAAGSPFSGNHTRQLILQKKTAEELGFTSPSAAIGQTLTLTFMVPEIKAGAAPIEGMPGFSVSQRKLSFTVCGVLEKQEGIFGNPLLRTDAYLPLGTVEELGLSEIRTLESLLRNFQAGSLFSRVEVRIKPNAVAADIEKKIQSMGFRTVSLTSILKEMNQVFLVMNSILGVIGSISLLVAGLGIANTMIITILERRREIGIMKAVGSTRGDIRQLFFVEGSIIGFFGGILGFLLAMATSTVINFFLNMYIKSHGGHEESFFTFPLWLFGSALVFSVLISLAAALYPSTRAARLDPVDSLRFE